ncbi:MAG: PA14 domain-containing protein [Planctomycetota bacterium]
MNDRASQETVAEQHRLLTALLDGVSTPAEREQIVILLRQDAAFRHFYLERLELHALLAWQLRNGAAGGLPASLADGSTNPKTASLRLLCQRKSVQQTSRWRWQHIAACVATVLFVVLVGAWALRSEPAFVLMDVQGDVKLERNKVQVPVADNTVIKPGDLIITNWHSSAKIQCQRLGSTVQLNEESRIVLPLGSEKTFKLETGALDAVVAHQKSGSAVYFDTLESSTKVIGTDFRLVAEKNRTFLLMNEGKVEFKGAKESVPSVVKGQEMAVVSPDSKVWVSPRPVDGKGTGLRGDYFQGKNFDSFVLFQIDPQIHFIWKGVSPIPGKIPVNDYSIRWTGFIEPRYTETYTFELHADDFGYLWVDDKLVVRVENGKHFAASGSVKLTAGKKHLIKFEYIQLWGFAKAGLYWKSRSQPREIVPQSQLYPPVNKP